MFVESHYTCDSGRCREEWSVSVHQKEPVRLKVNLPVRDMETMGLKKKEFHFCNEMCLYDFLLDRYLTKQMITEE